MIVQPVVEPMEHYTALPDGDAGGAGPVQRVREAEGRAEQQAWEYGVNEISRDNS